MSLLSAEEYLKQHKRECSVVGHSLAKEGGLVFLTDALVAVQKAREEKEIELNLKNLKRDAEIFTQMMINKARVLRETAKEIIQEWVELCNKYDKDLFNSMRQSNVEIMIEEQKEKYLSLRGQTADEKVSK